jgi:hypothetical protein
MTSFRRCRRFWLRIRGVRWLTEADDAESPPTGNDEVQQVVL